MLKLLIEVISERLPPSDGEKFLGDIQEAIRKSEKDLSKVVWKFVLYELRALPPQIPEIQSVIDQAICGMDLLSKGIEWPDATSLVRTGVYTAADFAKDHRSHSAIFAAVYAADIARLDTDNSKFIANFAIYVAEADSDSVFFRQRDALLSLIREPQ